MITGLDMVMEEDYNTPADEFLEVLYAAKLEFDGKLEIIMHAGESNSRNNTEVFDAVLLGAKRIGHGFSLAKHPKLIEMVKKNDICIECCPVSNQVLGYIHDLRCHPIRGLIQQGVKVSISSDDQGFWCVKNVSFDYLKAFLAWDLNISDLKTIMLNSITYSTCTD